MEAHHERVKHTLKRHVGSLSFNERIGLLITNYVGTMYCAYVFCAIAFVALPQAVGSHSFTVFINWVSSNWMQLVLLPIIIVGQNISNRAFEHLIAEIYKDTEEIKQLLKPVDKNDLPQIS